MENATTAVVFGDDVQNIAFTEENFRKLIMLSRQKDEKIAGLEKNIEALVEAVDKVEKDLSEVEKRQMILDRYMMEMQNTQEVHQMAKQVVSVTKNVTGAEKAEFYAYDCMAEKYYTFENEVKRYIRDNTEIASKEDMQVVNDTKNLGCIQDYNDNVVKVVSPCVNSDGEILGILVAEKSDGFTQESINDLKPEHRIVGTAKMGLNAESAREEVLIDKLTNSYNQRGFENKARTEWVNELRAGKQKYIFNFDIDNFKAKNDTYGHDGGDYVLAEVVAAMKSELREGTAVCGRMHGEELYVAVTCDKEDAFEIGERVRKAIENHHYEYNGTEIPNITVSMGVREAAAEKGEYITSEKAVHKVMEAYNNADELMYQSKAQGKNQLVVPKDVYYAYLAKKVTQAAEKDSVDKKALINALWDSDTKKIESAVNKIEAPSERLNILNAIEDISKVENPAYKYYSDTFVTAMYKAPSKPDTRIDSAVATQACVKGDEQTIAKVISGFSNSDKAMLMQLYSELKNNEPSINKIDLSAIRNELSKNLGNQEKAIEKPSERFKTFAEFKSKIEKFAESVKKAMPEMKKNAVEKGLENKKGR